MAIPTQASNDTSSLAIHTVAAVNILSEDAYKALKKEPSQWQWPLQPNDLNLSGVTGSNIYILGKVSRLVKLAKRISPFHTDYYITSNFGLPVDRLLWLTTMKTHGIIINTFQNTVSYCRRVISGREGPIPQATMPNHDSPLETT